MKSTEQKVSCGKVVAERSFEKKLSERKPACDLRSTVREESTRNQRCGKVVAERQLRKAKEIVKR